MHGLNFSPTWNLARIAAALPVGDPRSAPLLAAAERHAERGRAATLAVVHYAGPALVPTFAVSWRTE